MAATVEEGSVVYADIRPPSNIVLPEYAQIDRAKKKPGIVRNNRSNSDLIVHENSLYRSAPINKKRKESGSDSDEIFEENEVYASSTNQ